MDAHENARTTPHSRMLIVARLGPSVAAVAASLGVTTHTVRKWRDRYAAEGQVRLRDRCSSRRATPSRAGSLRCRRRSRRSLTWDQGAEMSQHAQLRVDTGVQVYFCDPHNPWQRGTNENTNGLLRQYFLKGTDLSAHGADDLAAVAAALNARPRKTLGWRMAAEALDEVLRSAQTAMVLSP